MGMIFESCLERLVEDPNLWPDLVQHLGKLPHQYRRTAIERLAETQITDEQTRAALWLKLNTLLRQHLDHPDSEWAMSAEELTTLTDAARLFKPLRAAVRYAWLFTDAFLNLGTRIVVADYAAELDTRRETAIAEAWQEGGFASVLELAQAADSPYAVGHALARTQYDIDELELARSLDSVSEVLFDVARGYLGRKYRADFPRLSWLVGKLEGHPLAQARLLQLADDVEAAWADLGKRSNFVTEAYWKEFYPYGRGADFPFGISAARHLAEAGRVALALDALSHYRDGKEEMDIDLIVSSFQRLIDAKDDELGVLSSYEVNNLMELLRQSAGVEEETLARLEWALLPILDSDPTSSTLQQRLARSPHFFIEILSLLYSGEDEEGQEPSHVDAKIATNAWRLLNDWKVTPGSDQKSQEINEHELSAWVSEAQGLAITAGRGGVADLQIGQMLARSHAASGDVWPPRPVATVIEDFATEAMLRGFSMGAYNKRGITSRGLEDGGKSERELAKRFRGWADALKFQSPKTARVLRELASGYEDEGRRRDDEAQRFQEGFGFGN
ncbi:hypothetical protein [Clavibacter sp. CFBP 8619]|uniref:hypothetical protein n=2 Tax=unclassified Clavibacter TaxID=2626594 RepID=UPI0040557C61